MTSERVKKFAIIIGKVAISAAILTYLFRSAWNDQSFEDLWGQSKNWPVLGAALLTTLVAVMITFYRWYLLVRALDIPFRVVDSFRLGFLAYLFNFFSLGIIGGDVLKSVYLARQNTDNHGGAVASVILDRVLGLFAMLLLGSVSFLAFQMDDGNIRDVEQFNTVRQTCQAAMVLTCIAGAGIGLAMTPGVLNLKLWDRLSDLPVVGTIWSQLLAAGRIYQTKRSTIFVAIGMSLIVHLLNTISFYLVAYGLPGDEPPLLTHFVIIPIAIMAGALPLPGGLGALEIALDFLYRAVSTVSVAERQGFIVALAYRVVQMVIASVGLIYYLVGRNEVQDLIERAQHEDEAPQTAVSTVDSRDPAPAGASCSKATSLPRNA